MPQSIGYVLSALLFIFLIVLIVVAAAGGSAADGDVSLDDAAILNAAADGEINTSADVESARETGGEIVNSDDAEITSASVNTSPANPCGGSVALGDDETLFGVAQRCSTTVDAILASNPDITDVTRIPVGARIALPAADSAASAATEAEATTVDAASLPIDGAIYIIQPGDTLARIAQQRGVTLVQLVDANPDISNPDSIRVGQTIVLPTE